jgi:hypothetical protein
MVSIKCDKHMLYNGEKLHAEPCLACSVIHTVNKLTYHVPDLERIKPIKVVDLSLASTPSLLAEIEKRIG